MKLIQAITTGKMEVIDILNELYHENKNDLGVCFDYGLLYIASQYMINISRSTALDRTYSVIELNTNVRLDGENNVIVFGLNPRKDETSVKVYIHNETDHFTVETILNLQSNETGDLDKDLIYDALFYECYRSVLQYVLERSGDDVSRVRKILHTIQTLKRDRVLAFDIHDWHRYTLLVNTQDLKYKRLESTNKFAPALLGTYLLEITS